MTNDQLIAQARSRFDHQTARRLQKEKYQTRMLFTYRGGLWRAGPELQTTLLTCPDTQAVLTDLYDTPVQVDTKELLTQSQQLWQEQMNAWLIEHHNSQRER